MELKAKRHSALESLKKDLSRGRLEKEVTVDGHKFKLHTLNEDEETWADGYIKTLTPTAFLSSRKAPRLAAAISSMDGIPKEELFVYPDDMPKEAKQALDESPERRKQWVREQMLLFLAEDGTRPFVEKLYAGLEDLDKERAKAIEALPNS